MKNKAISRNFLLVITFMMSNFVFTQVDYLSLVKNLDIITEKTDIIDFFSNIPVEKSDNELICRDERFLKYYGIIVDKVVHAKNYNTTYLEITFFNKKEDFDKLIIKLTENFGEPEKYVQKSYDNYSFSDEKQFVEVRINKENEIFESFNGEVRIRFKEQ